jgi:hypothetical protein
MSELVILQALLNSNCMDIKVSNTCLGEHIVYSNTDIAIQLSIQQLKIFNTPIVNTTIHHTKGQVYNTNINYLCNQCLSPLKLWVRNHLRTRCTRYNIILCGKICRCISTGRLFSDTPFSSSNKTDRYEITELLVQFKHQYRNPVDPSYFSHPIIDTVAFGVLKNLFSSWILLKYCLV